MALVNAFGALTLEATQVAVKNLLSTVSTTATAINSQVTSIATQIASLATESTQIANRNLLSTIATQTAASASSAAGMATEATQSANKGILQTLLDNSNALGTESTLRKVLASTTYARTTSDQLRVSVDNQAIVSVYAGNTNATIAATAIPINGQNSWNANDAREIAREASELHFTQTRNRWSIT